MTDIIISFACALIGLYAIVLVPFVIFVIVCRHVGIGPEDPRAKEIAKAMRGDQS